MKITVFRGLVVLVSLVSVAAGGPATDNAPWLWPPPHRLDVLEGRMPMEGTSVLIPDAAGRRVTAIANAVCAYVNHYHKSNVGVVRIKNVSQAPHTLVLSKTATAAAFEKQAAAAVIDSIPKELPDRRIWRRESYVLRTSPEGAALAAPEPWGLLQGARTLMQMAKVAARTGHDSLPAVRIVDWSEMPSHHFCVVGPTRCLRDNNDERVSALLAELKYNHVMFALYNNGMAHPLHPEIRGDRASWEALRSFANHVRSMGLPTWPWVLDYAAGPHKGGGPMVYSPNSGEYFRVRFEWIDSVLEAFRPNALNFCMSEQGLAKKRWNGFRRNRKDWETAVLRHCDFLLRRGVTPSVWELWSRSGRPSAFGQAYKDTVERIPRELILCPWNYANRGRYACPTEKLAGKEFGFRVMNGCATWSTDGTYHAQHMARHGKRLPNLWGLTAVVWRGGDGEHGTKAVYRCAGPLWNSRLDWTLKRFDAGVKPATETAPARRPPADAAPAREPKPPRLAAHVERLKDKDARAREQAYDHLVGCGAAAAAELIEAMSKSLPLKEGEPLKGALRGELKGILSRISRKERKWQDLQATRPKARKSLDTTAVAKYLNDSCPHVRETACRLVATCAPRERAAAVIRKGLANEATRVFCVRAASSAGLGEVAGEIAAIVRDEKASAETRILATRSLVSHWRMRGSAAVCPEIVALPEALRGAKDPDLRKELERAISLLRKSQVAAEGRRVREAAPYNVRFPDFTKPLGLEAMLWREPDKPVSEYVARLKNADAFVWEEAREELVGFGAGGAAEMLAAMAKAPAVKIGVVCDRHRRPLRWKLEGALSRICRDGRQGEASGRLDVKAVEKYLRDPCPYVSDIAAELIASCAPKDDALAIILKGLRKKKAFSSCARAAGIAGFQKAADELAEVASNEKALLASRVAAARYLGYLKPARAGKPLLDALKGAKDVGLKMELIRTLSLIGMKEAEDEIARHLDKSNDKFARLRAAIALVNLASKKSGGVESWLTEDDRAIVEIGCWALGKAHPAKEALKIVERNIARQENETLKEALRYQVEKRVFLRW